jgi:hypothetical protein
MFLVGVAVMSSRSASLVAAGKRKQFFFEKKNQKLLFFQVHVARQNRDSDIKVFCFFSSEKKICLR